MTVEELHKRLIESGISENGYYLQGLYGSSNDSDKIALTVKKGKYSIEYEVYFKERNEKHSIKIFTSEDEACQYIFDKLIKNNEVEDKYSKVSNGE